jgi:GH15 family glucan-1,4-alpha-glucosidase
MTQPIESYALLSDLHTAALVGRDGSVDWFCPPRFDSPACFAALLGDRHNGRWRIAPRDPVTHIARRYRPGTLVLETDFTTASGAVRVTDCLARPCEGAPHLVRRVEGLRGEVAVDLELIIRFYYGSVVPWVMRNGESLRAVAGPDAIKVHADVPLRGKDLTTVGAFTLREGEARAFTLVWHKSHHAAPERLNAATLIDDTTRAWQEWSGACTYDGPYREDVLGSLTVLKGLTYAPTGGLVAAPTMSLPERLGGVRNWDYRYCWLRDATLTLYAMLSGGFRSEAQAWRDWLLRAVAGDMRELQIMYGPAGERRLAEWEVPWLPGYGGAAPVRAGNGAMTQRQLDVYGEVMDVLYQARRHGMPADPWAWRLQKRLLDFLESHWAEPDEGIWEVRGPRRHFTHSKVMAWVAFDRAIKTVGALEAEGPVERWRAVRDALHAEVCARGYDAGRNTFVQCYGTEKLDASTLLIPLVGFLPHTDARVRGTVRAIEHGLVRDGLVMRYTTDDDGSVDGLPGDEGAFLACTFWLADNYAQQGRAREAGALFERLLALRNDVGLLAEEYDPRAQRQLGNFPQAFSHLALVNSACNLIQVPGCTSRHRAE